MSTVNLLYGTKTNLTITLASLAASATVGRQSTVVDSTVNNPLDVLISGFIDAGVVTGNKQVLFYVAGSIDSGTSYSMGNGTNVIGASDAGFTRVDPSGITPAYILACPTASVKYSFGPFSVAQTFGGLMPDHWALVVFNDTGVALSATGANNAAFYREVRATVA